MWSFSIFWKIYLLYSGLLKDRIDRMSDIISVNVAIKSQVICGFHTHISHIYDTYLLSAEEIMMVEEKDATLSS